MRRMARNLRAEREAREADQKLKAAARETRKRVRRVVSGREEMQEVNLHYESTITKQRHLCYSDPIGRGRFTAARFMSDCCEESRAVIVDAWRKGEQLIARRVPVDALPCVVIMASYLRLYDAELVDDFDALIERANEHIKEYAHPDKFLSSCICILHKRWHSPDEEAFDSVNVPGIYEEMF